MKIINIFDTIMSGLYLLGGTAIVFIGKSLYNIFVGPPCSFLISNLDHVGLIILITCRHVGLIILIICRHVGLIIGLLLTVISLLLLGILAVIYRWDPMNNMDHKSE